MVEGAELVKVPFSQPNTDQNRGGLQDLSDADALYAARQAGAPHADIDALRQFIAETACMAREVNWRECGFSSQAVSRK